MQLNISKEKGQDLMDRYEAGATLKDLAKELECSAPTVSRFLTELGVKIRGRGRRKKEKTVPIVVETPEIPTDDLPESQQDKLAAFRQKIVGSLNTNA